MSPVFLVLSVLAAVTALFFLILWLVARHFFGRGKAIYDLNVVLRDHPDQLARIQRGRDANAKRTSESITTTSDDGLTLYGALYHPDEPSNNYIVCMHGFRSSLNDFDCAVEFFLQEGYHVLLVHQRAHGKSEGAFITFGMKERYDCLCWCRELMHRYGNNISIVLDGISMGATTVVMASALELPPTVRGVIADCGFSSPWDIVCRVAGTMHIPSFPLLHLMRFALRLYAGFDLKELTAEEAIRNAKVPVMLIHGTEDDFVPADNSVRLHRANPEKSSLLLVEGAGHGLSYLIDEACCREACAKILRQETDPT